MNESLMNCSSGEFYKFFLGYENLSQVNYPIAAKIYLHKDVHHSVAYVTFAQTLETLQLPNTNKWLTELWHITK